MNIKSLNINLTSALDTARRPESTARTQMSAEDRDADGRQGGQSSPEKKRVSDQEFDDALKILSETPGLKANNLSLRVEVTETARLVLILAPDGQVVRRMTESQLWAATRDKNRATGNMLNKKM